LFFRITTNSQTLYQLKVIIINVLVTITDRTQQKNIAYPPLRNGHQKGRLWQHVKHENPMLECRIWWLIFMPRLNLPKYRVTISILQAALEGMPFSCGAPLQN